MATATKKAPKKAAKKSAKGAKVAKTATANASREMVKVSTADLKKMSSYMTVDDIAKKEGVARTTVLKHIRAGKVKGVYGNGKLGRGRQYLIKKSEYKGLGE